MEEMVEFKFLSVSRLRHGHILCKATWVGAGWPATGPDRGHLSANRFRKRRFDFKGAQGIFLKLRRPSRNFCAAKTFSLAPSREFAPQVAWTGRRLRPGTKIFFVNCTRRVKGGGMANAAGFEKEHYALPGVQHRDAPLRFHPGSRKSS
jgi:hypothetical protein